MKKTTAYLLASLMMLSLSACGGNSSDTASTEPSESESSVVQESQSTDSESPDSAVEITGDAPEGAETDETKLGEAITYSVKDDTLYLKIKTSAEFDAQKSVIAIVNPGFYLTRNSEFISQCLFDEYCFDESADKEWFDGVYTFALDSRISSIAADEEWSPNTWTMMLYDGESNDVIGQWLFVTEGGGKYHFEYKDSWLKGAGEDKTPKEFDNPQDEIASWFTFNEYNEEWAEFFFDGYYLEETDPQGYDKYYLMVCPEGEYTTYDEAMEAHLGDYSGIAEKCPYKFSIYHQDIEPGKYTMVLAKDGGDAEIQFGVEKTSDTKWTMDFSNASCKKLS